MTTIEDAREAHVHTCRRTAYEIECSNAQCPFEGSCPETFCPGSVGLKVWDFCPGGCDVGEELDQIEREAWREVEEESLRHDPVAQRFRRVEFTSRSKARDKKVTWTEIDPKTREPVTKTAFVTRSRKHWKEVELVLDRSNPRKGWTLSRNFQWDVVATEVLPHVHPEDAERALQAEVRRKCS